MTRTSPNPKTNTIPFTQSCRSRALKPFTWETKEPKGDFQEFIRSEGRYKTLLKTAPNEAEELFKQAEEDAKQRMSFYKNMGEIM